MIKLALAQTTDEHTEVKFELVCGARDLFIRDVTHSRNIMGLTVLKDRIAVVLCENINKPEIYHTDEDGKIIEVDEIVEVDE